MPVDQDLFETLVIVYKINKLIISLPVSVLSVY